MQATITIREFMSQEMEPLFEGVIPMDQKVRLTPEVIQYILGSTPLPEKVFVHILIDPEVSLIEVCDLCDVFIEAYSNVRPRIAVLNVKNVPMSFHINDCDIKHADFVDSPVLTVYCNIRHVQVRSATRDSKDKRRVDLRNSRVDHLQVGVNLDLLSVTGANIREALIWSRQIDSVYVGQHARIENLIMTGGPIEHFRIDDGIIGRLEFSPETKIKKLDLRTPMIDSCIGIRQEAFDEKNLGVWQLCRLSALSHSDPNLIAETTFKYMQEWLRGLPTWHSRFGYRLIGFTCGFGYRPHRAVIASIVVIALFSAFYYTCTITSSQLSSDGALKSLIGHIGNPPEQDRRFIPAILESLYFSVVTFATVGYGDLAPTGFLTRVLAAIEALLGVTLMGTFVSSLIIRFGKTS